MMIDIDYFDSIGLLKLNRSVTNAINLDLVNALAEGLNTLESDPKVRGMVLSSANDKFFSIGFDIPELFALNRIEFENFYRAFNQTCFHLFALTIPVVAALPGHAIAGGYILSLCCDYRYLSEGHKLIGLNEVKLGLPVPYLADSILRSLIGGRLANQVVQEGEFLCPNDSLQMGIVDQVLTPDRLLPEAIAKTKQLAGLPANGFASIKRNWTEIIETKIQERWDQKIETFLDSWFSPQNRDLLETAMRKF